jgi:hypothetical protein
MVQVPMSSKAVITGPHFGRWHHIRVHVFDSVPDKFDLTRPLSTLSSGFFRAGHELKFPIAAHPKQGHLGLPASLRSKWRAGISSSLFSRPFFPVYVGLRHNHHERLPSWWEAKISPTPLGFAPPPIQRLRTCLVDGYDSETQWTKLQNGAQMMHCLPTALGTGECRSHFALGVQRPSGLRAARDPRSRRP